MWIDQSRNAEYVFEKLRSKTFSGKLFIMNLFYFMVRQDWLLNFVYTFLNWTTSLRQDEWCMQYCFHGHSRKHAAKTLPYDFPSHEMQCQAMQDTPSNNPQVSDLTITCYFVQLVNAGNINRSLLDQLCHILYVRTLRVV